MLQLRVFGVPRVTGAVASELDRREACTAGA